MKFSLFERLEAWIRMLRLRTDLTFKPDVHVEPAKEPLPDFFPEDLRAFGAHTSELSFVYRGPAGTDAAGFLCLTPSAMNEPAYLELDGEVVDEGAMYILDGDIEGTGKATWLVAAPGKAARIVYSLEAVLEFPSFTEYVTEGAKRGFEYGQWQADARKRSEQRNQYEGTLSSSSLPRSTPLPELRAGLVARGLEAEMADDLIEWLGADVALLLPK